MREEIGELITCSKLNGSTRHCKVWQVKVESLASRG